MAAPTPARLFMKWPSEKLTLCTSSPPTPIRIVNTSPANRSTKPHRMNLLCRCSERSSRKAVEGCSSPEPGTTDWPVVASDTRVWDSIAWETRARLMPHERQNFWLITVSVAQFGQYISLVLSEAIHQPQSLSKFTQLPSAFMLHNYETRLANFQIAIISEAVGKDEEDKYPSLSPGGLQRPAIGDPMYG